MRLRAILANRSPAQGGELSSKPNTGLGAVGEPILDLDGHLHDKISDQVDLADRGAGSDPVGRQSVAPVKSLTKIFTVFIQWADKSGGR